MNKHLPRKRFHGLSVSFTPAVKNFNVGGFWETALFLTVIICHSFGLHWALLGFFMTFRTLLDAFRSISRLF